MRRQSLLAEASPSRDEREYRRWYFGFSKNTTTIPWYQRLAMRNDPVGLQHCYAFTQIGDYVLIVEPMRDRVEFTLSHPVDNKGRIEAIDVAHELIAQNHTVVVHEYIPGIRGVKSIWNWIPSCVTVVKCAAGFSSTALTPKQLLNCLIKNGATQIF